MNKEKEQHFAICIIKCKIIDIKNVNSKNGFIIAGSLVKIIDELPSDTSVITVCVTNNLNYQFTPNLYHCPTKSLQKIPALLWQILLPVKPALRANLIKNSKIINYLLKIRVNDNVLISGGSIKIPGILSCSIKYVGEIPEKGSGIFFGVELQKTSTNISKEFQASYINKYNMNFNDKCFIATAEQIILPADEQKTLLDEEIPTNLNWRALDIPTKPQNFNNANKINLEIEQKSEMLRDLTNKLSLLNVKQQQRPEDKIRSIQLLQQQLSELDECTKNEQEQAPILTTNFLQKTPSVNDTIHCLPLTSIQYPFSQGLPSLPLKNGQNMNVIRDGRNILLNFLKDLVYIRQMNNFPSTDEDINLIKSIEHDLSVIRNNYKSTLTSLPMDNIKLPKPGPKPAPATKPVKKINPNQFQCFKCNKTFMNKVKITVDQCNHEYCKMCFIKCVSETKKELQCPYINSNDNEQCKTIVKEKQIENIVTPDIYKKYAMIIKLDMICNIPNSYRCIQVNCIGWWICEDPDIKLYSCPICQIQNCVVCKAIHTGTCKEYERKIIYGTNKEASALMLEKLTVEEKLMHKLINEENVKTDSQAENALGLFKLLPKQKKDDIYWAVKQTDSIDIAMKLLEIICELCTNIYPRYEIENMIHCQHFCCRFCAVAWFTERITDHSILSCLCPFCFEPKLDEMEEHEICNYFALIDPLLKRILTEETYDIFQTKVRDRGLGLDKDFKWCSTCSSGFFIQPNQVAVTCPTCYNVTCANCRVPWEEQHLGIPCDQFAEWKRDNNPDNQEQGLNAYLDEHGIQCPQCKFKYALTKGGCIHFHCTQCLYQFCCGCNQQMSDKCRKQSSCSSKGLHAHHPRNCFYYLRDYSVDELQQLLTTNNIEFIKTATNPTTTCKIPIQNSDASEETICNGIVASENELCEKHFKEYLVDIINKSNIDPITLMDLVACEQELIRNNIALPAVEKTSPNAILSFRTTVQNNIPLEVINVTDT